jgi:copper chaperone
MKKFVSMSLACLALLAFVAAPTFACDGNKTTSANASTGTDGKLASSDSKASCAGMKNASTTSADGKSCCAGHGTATSASADGEKCPATGCEMVTMSVKGMTCGGCETTVRASLEKVPGVVKVMSVSYKDGTALVCMDPKKCKAESLTSAVSDKGYEAEVIPAVAKTTADGKSCAGMDKAACAAKCAAKGEKTTQDSK